MDEKLKGKKLLILGAYRTEIEIINEAKKNGIYTIVTDNHSNWDQAPAKKIADEAWNISWSEIELLKRKCMAERVDGVIAGFSERRILFAQKLCEALGKPFYSMNSDLNTICDKKRFKEACKKVGVPVAKSYQYGEEIAYPVIVKPADNGGSRGITVCYTEEELKVAYKKALACSDSGEVLIEQYLSGDEIMVYFTVHDGEIEFSTMCDRYMEKFDKNITQLPIGYYYPSKYLSVFMEHNFEKYKKLIQHFNIQNGLIAFQAFVIHDEIIPFDPTYRLDGTMSYHLTEVMKQTNVLKMLINHSLTGKMGEFYSIKVQEKKELEGIGFELPILLKKGQIKSVKGLHDVLEMEPVIYICEKHFEGEYMENSADFSQMLCRIHIYVENEDILKNTLQNIYNTLQVLDENGEDMVIGRFPIEIIGVDK